MQAHILEGASDLTPLRSRNVTVKCVDHHHGTDKGHEREEKVPETRLHRNTMVTPVGLQKSRKIRETVVDFFAQGS